MGRIVLYQLLAVLCITVIAYLISAQTAAISALFGGLCCAVPNALFVLRLSVKGRDLSTR